MIETHLLSKLLDAQHKTHVTLLQRIMWSDNWTNQPTDLIALTISHVVLINLKCLSQSLSPKIIWQIIYQNRLPQWRSLTSAFEVRTHDNITTFVTAFHLHALRRK